MHSFSATSRTPTGGLPFSVPTRSFSFSTQQTTFPSALRGSSRFASTFEDDESGALSDTYASCPPLRSLAIAPLPRISLVARPSRSRQPLAVEPVSKREPLVRGGQSYGIPTHSISPVLVMVTSTPWQQPVWLTWNYRLIPE